MGIRLSHNVPTLWCLSGTLRDSPYSEETKSLRDPGSPDKTR
jgi:hypothetical protein